jgi:cell division septum initiation protein DivIVA
MRTKPDSKPLAIDAISSRIVTIRGERVLLDADLAALYDVATKALNQAARRNAERFPSDFAFQLTPTEAENLKSHFATSRLQPTDSKADFSNRSQFVTASQKHRDPRFAAWVFTEHGALMAANILRSRRAVQMSVQVVRAFVRLREMVAANKDLAAKLDELERRVSHHDEAIIGIIKTIRELAIRPEPTPKRRIGFISEN